MSRLKFDIKYRPQIESGEYRVKTRDGRDARIICWDSKAKDARLDPRPIIALVTTPIPELEDLIQCGENGILYKGAQDRNDLFIVTPEEELTEFEQSIVNTIENELHHTSDDGSVSFGVSIDNETAKILAKRLLSLAREQFIKDGYVIEKKAFRDAVEKIDDKHKAEMSIEYSLHCKVENRTRHAVMNWEAFQKVAQKFIDIGRADALKDLPRWKKDKSFETEGTFMAFMGVNGRECFVVNDGYSISVAELIEKLPGFKED